MPYQFEVWRPTDDTNTSFTKVFEQETKTYHGYQEEIPLQYRDGYLRPYEIAVLWKKINRRGDRDLSRISRTDPPSLRLLFLSWLSGVTIVPQAHWYSAMVVADANGGGIEMGHPQLNLHSDRDWSPYKGILLSRGHLSAYHAMVSDVQIATSQARPSGRRDAAMDLFEGDDQLYLAFLSGPAVYHAALLARQGFEASSRLIEMARVPSSAARLA